MAFQLLEECFFDAEIARIKHVLAFLVLQGTPLVSGVLVVVDHVLQRVRDVQHGQVASVSTELINGIRYPWLMRLPKKNRKKTRRFNTRMR